MVTNLSPLEPGVLGRRCDLLVGYDTRQRLEGMVPLRFAQALDLDPQRPLQVLAKVVPVNGAFELEGKSVYQPIK
jgi:hypothetical protein